MRGPGGSPRPRRLPWLPPPDRRDPLKTAFRVGEYVYVRIDVRSGSATVANDSVRSEIKTAAGNIYSGTAATNSQGYVVFTFRSVATDGKGTYSATATVTRTGYANGARATSFTVN